VHISLPLPPFSPRYTKAADWGYISKSATAQVADHPRLLVIGNGDVYNFEQWEEHLTHPEVETCMLARGALVKPWLPTEIKERRHWDISAGERFDILKDFVNHGLEHWGSDQRGVNTTRRFLLEVRGSGVRGGRGGGVAQGSVCSLRE
jgi:tRNA-dihydrouridine synthase 3